MTVQEEIQLLERKLELLREIDALQSKLNSITYSVYPIYPTYPQSPTQPWVGPYYTTCNNTTLNNNEVK